MSDRAIANPRDIRDFAIALSSFNRELADATASLRAKFVRLGDTWRDNQHEQFALEFEELVHALGRFYESAEDQIPKLNKKAEIIEEYLRHRR